jgi:hypothetical protein
VYPVQQRLDEISNLFGGSSFIKVDHLADSVVIYLIFIIEYFLVILCLCNIKYFINSFVQFDNTNVLLMEFLTFYLLIF